MIDLKKMDGEIEILLDKAVYHIEHEEFHQWLYAINTDFRQIYDGFTSVASITWTGFLIEILNHESQKERTCDNFLKLCATFGIVRRQILNQDDLNTEESDNQLKNRVKRFVESLDIEK